MYVIMSVYSQYQEYINTFINLDKSQWTFKSDPNYTYILEHVNQSQGVEYLSEITSRFKNFYTENKNLLIDLCNKNDLYGTPKKFIFEDFTTCSPTNLRYILHSLLILTYMKECKLNSVDLIEIGGGYGGLYFFLNKLSVLFNISITSYIIFDLYEPCLLQQKYLEDSDISNLKFMQIDNFNDIKENSFLISNYAFSEISLELQHEYTKKILNPYVSYGFLAWNITGLYTFIENKSISSEKEFPMTSGGKNNLYVKFSPL